MKCTMRDYRLRFDILIDVKYIKGRKVRGMKKIPVCQNLGCIVYGVKDGKPKKYPIPIRGGLQYSRHTA